MTDIGKKQYLLSSKKLNLQQMRELCVGDFHLYTHPLLQVQTAVTHDGEKLILLGHAYCMDGAGKTALQDMENWDSCDLAALTRFWTGRWVLITESTLLTDACGLMSAFYYQDKDFWCISSSLALLHQLLGISLDAPVLQTGLSWQLLPNTRVKRVKLLLSSQKLLLGNALRVCPHLWMTNETALSAEEKCRRVADYLTNGMSNLYAFSEKKLHLALTGGKDSRLVLAAAWKAGIPFQAYTAQHSAISSCDINIPAQLAKRYGFSHSFIKKASAQAELYKDYDRFTAGNSMGADREFYACGQFSSFGTDALIIRGGLFEAGQTYARSYTSASIDGFADGMKRYYSALQDAWQKEAFDAWLEITRANPLPHVDIRDRFYLEQRVGGWAAAIEQSLDICDFTSIQIANCPALLSVLLSADETERKNLDLAYGTIRMLEPSLMDFAVNQSSISDKLRYVCAIMRNPIKKLRAYLSKRSKR